MSIRRSALLPVFLLAWTTAAAGCAGAVVGAAAGTAAGIAYTDRGAEAQVKGNVKDVTKNTEDVFKKNNISVKKSEMRESGKEHDFDAVMQDNNISVTIKESGKDISHVDVTASKGFMKWNKDYAKQILQDIVKKSS